MFFITADECTITYLVSTGSKNICCLRSSQIKARESAGRTNARRAASHPGHITAAEKTKYKFDAQNSKEEHVLPGNRISPETTQHGVRCLEDSYSSG